MDSRDKEVLNMQLTLVPILAKAWNKTYSELSDIFKKYDVADSCKCIEYQEETKESSFFDKTDLVKEFLGGKTGLPITLVFKNNELVEIQFSS